MKELTSGEILHAPPSCGVDEQEVSVSRDAASEERPVKEKEAGLGGVVAHSVAGEGGGDGGDDGLAEGEGREGYEEGGGGVAEPLEVVGVLARRSAARILPGAVRRPLPRVGRRRGVEDLEADVAD